jgi:FixJ family two-component response regulator
MSGQAPVIVTQLERVGPTAEAHSLHDSNGGREDVTNGAASTVFVVDRSWKSRMALSQVLAAAGYQVRLFESAEHFLGVSDVDTPGCLLVDLCVAGAGGLALQRALAGLPCARPIVFTTDIGDIETSVQAMKSGAVDFLMKPIDVDRLLVAIERAMQRDIRQRLQYATRSVIQQRFQRLTPRERQVMARIICGLLNKQIGADLGIGEKTVKVHRARVMSKMGARSVPALVHLGARVGLAGETWQTHATRPVHERWRCTGGLHL